MQPRTYALPNEFLQAQRVIISHETGRYLYVANPPGRASKMLHAERKIFLSGMDNRLDLGVTNQLPHAGDFQFQKRIDDIGGIADGDLNQADFRLETIFHDEFRIERELSVPAALCTYLIQPLLVINRYNLKRGGGVLHANSLSLGSIADS
jgi:hypothetical protein